MEGQGESGEGHDADPVELGVQLLERLEHHELSLARAIDRIETVTSHPARTREILDTAEKRGIIEREDGVVRVTGGRFLAFQSEVVRREGEFTCKRCGASLSVGHFMKLEAGELGPFGSSCIRKVTGRESE
jgi:predicted methyltransferase